MRLYCRDVFVLSSPPAAPPSKPVRGIGPAIVVILIILAAILGYYQLVYYPTVAVTSTTTTGGPTPTTPFNVTITILPGAGGSVKPRDQTFTPNVVTVYVGYNSTVIWVNNDTVLHTVTANASSPDPAFNSWGPISAPYNNIQPAGQAGDTLNYTFTVPGTYGYYCSYHPWMIGTIIVKPAPAGLTTTTTGAAAGAGGSATTSSSVSSASIITGFASNYLFVTLTADATTLAKSLATLTGSGSAPWSVNLSNSLFAWLSVIPEVLTKT